MSNDLTNQLLPCPFCGGTDIRYSIKVSKTTGKRQYRATMYCNGCHAYSPRALTPYLPPYDYSGRHEVESDDRFKSEAIALWNKRTNSSEYSLKEEPNVANGK